MDLHAIITGSSKGVGLALTNLLLKNNFYIHGYSRSNKLTHPNYNFYPIDLSCSSSLKNLEFPNLNSSKKIFLINNAGDIGNIKKVGAKNAEDIINEININASAPAVLSNEFIKKYKKVDSDLIILNISSGAALRAIPSWGTYCVAKAGLDMLTNIINEEHKNVRALSIYPGIVNTEMQRNIREAKEEDFPLRQKFVDYYKNNDLSEPSAVAEKIFYIMSNLSKFDNNMISVRDLD